MILIKRIATATVLFVFFFVVCYFAICIGGGFVQGFMAGIRNPNGVVGANAGADFVKHNIGTITISALVIALLSAVALSFSGVLSWCRKPSSNTPA